MLWKKLIVLFFSVLSFTAHAATTQITNAPQRASKLKVYLSASLFNERETRFNLDVAKSLSQNGFDVILPQRDGFEYKALGAAIGNQLPSTSVKSVAANMIYILNMGKLIPESDVVIADLDQPIDEGVVVELTYAHLIGKPVIGIRTDLRSPYYEENALFSGVHSFVAYQCDFIVNQHQQIRNDADRTQSMKTLTTALVAQLQHISPTSNTLPKYAISNLYVANLTKAANILFANVSDIHSQQGINEVVNRLVNNKSKLTSLNIGIKFA